MNKDFDITDMWGDSCAFYDLNPLRCGNSDDDDFVANEVCCSCGGGVVNFH